MTRKLKKNEKIKKAKYSWVKWLLPYFPHRRAYPVARELIFCFWKGKECLVSKVTLWTHLGIKSLWWIGSFCWQGWTWNPGYSRGHDCGLWLVTVLNPGRLHLGSEVLERRASISVIWSCHATECRVGQGYQHHRQRILVLFMLLSEKQNKNKKNKTDHL